MSSLVNVSAVSLERSRFRVIKNLTRQSSGSNINTKNVRNTVELFYVPEVEGIVVICLFRGKKRQVLLL